MASTSFILIFVMAMGAAFVQRVTGFGFGIFIMSVLPYLLPSYGEATTLSGLLAIVSALPTISKFRKHLSWRKLLPILFTFLIISWVAVQLVGIAGDSFLKRLLGGMLILAAVWFYFLKDRVKVRPTWPIQVGLGTLSGFMGGLFGMQGPPAVLYFLATAKDKNEYMALTQAYFLIGNTVMTFFRARNGYLTAEVGWGWCCGVTAVAIGVWLGSIVFKRISANALRTLVYAYMAISGAVALLT